ncbi:MAG TPA: sodium-dependent transporter [Candidatus Omnitrophota bacterium]|nr:sodium-dependent transporter [Candidatus Omnitrophota bacterium]
MTTHPHTKPREQWGTRIGLIMAMAANAVGLGNFLRFPVQCANNGGGAFMIPYFIAFVLLGIPLLWIEWGIGRFGGKYGHGTTPGMFHYLWKHPWAKYVGAIGLAVPLLLIIYYNYIVSWTLAYSVFSFTGKYSGVANYQGMADFLAAFQGKVSNAYFPTIATAFLFFVITHFCMMGILARGVSKGIELLAKIAMPLICIFGIILVVRVLFLGTPDPRLPLNNVANGFGFIWNPDFSILKQSKVWLAATGQIFFTLSVGFGAIQVYASYLKEKDDVVLSGLATASTNEFCEVILGGSIAIPVVVAFSGLAQTKAIAAGGAFDLGFFAMPMIFQKMAWGPFFGTIWFFLLFLAGLTSSVAITQPLMAFFQEEFKWTRKKTAWIVGVMTFFFSLPVIFFLKHGFLNELDFWVGTVGIVIFAIIEVVLFVWVFGSHNAWKEILSGADLKLPHFIMPIMKYVTLVYLVVLFLFWMFQDGWGVLMMKGVPKEDYPYIWFARFLLVAVGALMVFLVHIAWQKKHVIQQRVPE